MKLILIIFLGLIIFLIFLYSYAGNPFKKMVMCSEISGELRLNGHPVKNATLVRELKWSWKSETIMDNVITDKDGKFVMPQVLRSSLLGRLLPHEPGVRQTITVIHEDKKYNLWMHNKSSYNDLSELNGHRILLDCNLENEPERNEVYDSFGLCKMKTHGH